MNAYIAKIKAPILGWDFTKKYKLDTVWNEFGDYFLRDKRSQIKKKLDLVSIPHNIFPSFGAVVSNKEAEVARNLRFSAQCVAALGNTDKKEEHTEKYMELLNKFKQILKPNFKEAKTKHNVEHSIITKGPPCTAKARPILPGSHKAVEGYKAWKELVDLGIVEKVKPGCPVPWSSALHLQPKSTGGYRPCGDYRFLNELTETDDYPLPNVRHFSHKLKGSTH